MRALVAGGPAWRLAGGACVALGAAVTLRAGSRWRAENRLLDTALHDALGGRRIAAREDLAAIREYLRDSLKAGSLVGKRPLLRDSAAATLASGEGFCGERSRVAVRMLRRGGVPANRLYVWGLRWGHVVVEHRWDGRWRVFDASGEIGDAMSPDDLGAIDSSDVASFPNACQDVNPWLRAAPVRFWPSCPVRPPGFVTAAAESPDLLEAIAGTLVLASGLGVLARAAVNRPEVLRCAG